MKVSAYGVKSPNTPLVPLEIERKSVQAQDIAIKILYCGVCHSDLHTARGEWGGTRYPCVPGHEIVGEVIEIGNQVHRYKIGDIVGVGCLVDSCRTCNSCEEGLENYCEGPNGATGTYNGNFAGTLDNTYGGYSSKIVVDEHFVLKISHDLKDLPKVAPLLCAGITTYSPLRHWQVGSGKKVGIVGIGGLGHMAVKLAKAMGAYVVAFTSSPSKIEDAKKLGADEVVVSSDNSQMQKHFRSLDFILNTVAVSHNLDNYLNLLKRDSTMTMVGAPSHPHPSPAVFSLIFGRRSLAGSLIGGIKETQEMLDFCAKHNIVSDIEMINMKNIENAYERMLKSDVKYRFVIDMATL